LFLRLFNTTVTVRMLIGYARVSTEDQNLNLQRDALTSAGCERIFEDKASGARHDRPGLSEVLSHLRKGDCLVRVRFPDPQRLVSDRHDHRPRSAAVPYFCSARREAM